MASKSKTSSEIINNLKEIFPQHGIPSVVIAVNVPFESYEFKTLAEKWNIKAITSSLHYYQTFSIKYLAEHRIDIVMKIISKSQDKNNDLSLHLPNYRSSRIN